MATPTSGAATRTADTRPQPAQAPVPIAAAMATAAPSPSNAQLTASQAPSMNIGTQGKVLIVLSSSDHVTLEGGRQEPTGFFLNELCTPLSKMLDSGYSVEFANPHGSMPATDPLSKSLIWYLGSSAKRDKHQELIERMKVESNFGHPKKFSKITEADLEGYAGVFIPGGHAPMEDLHNNPDLGRILRYFHRTMKPTGAICHGPIAFLSLTDPDDHTSPFQYSTYKMTAYSNMEESINELKWFHKLKLHVQSELEKHGALFRSSMIPMGSHIEEDRELVTGQNPTSASAFAEAFVKKLNNPKEQQRRGSASSLGGGKVVAVQQ